MRINIYDEFSDEKFDKIIKYLTKFNPEINNEEVNDYFPDKWVGLTWNSPDDIKKIEVNFLYDCHQLNIYGTYYIFEEDVWSNEPDDQIIFDFVDWKSAWNWFNDDKFDLEQADLINKSGYYGGSPLTYPLAKAVLKKMTQKSGKLNSGGVKYFD